MTLPRLKAMTMYWEDHPPIHIMVAAYIGYKPPNRKAGQADDPAAYSDGLTLFDLPAIVNSRGV